MTVRYRRSPHAKERRVGTSLFLANPERGTLLRVNETVAALWNLLATPASRAEATAVFRRAFPRVRRARIESDVRRMFDDLLAEGLVERAGAVRSPKRRAGGVTRPAKRPPTS